MTRERTKSTKWVFVSYFDETAWEAWVLRSNRGSKKKRPVKFYAEIYWNTPNSRCPCAGMGWDFESERDAEVWFAESVAEHGGRVWPSSTLLLKKLADLGFNSKKWSIDSYTQPHI